MPPARDAQGRFIAGSGSAGGASGGGGGDVRIVLNPEGVRQLLKDPGVLAELERRGRAIASAAGEGMEVQSHVGANRVRVTVRTATVDAQLREATQRVLTNAIGAGNG
jgi:hypothetical protein